MSALKPDPHVLRLAPRETGPDYLVERGAVSQLTLREKLQHQRQYKGSTQYPLFTRAEALAAGYSEAEVHSVYGDDAYVDDDPRAAAAAKPALSFIYTDAQLLDLLERHLTIEFPQLVGRKLRFRLRHAAAGLRIDVFDAPESA